MRGRSKETVKCCCTYLNDIFQGIVTVTIVFSTLFAAFLIFLPIIGSDLMDMEAPDVIKSFLFKTAAVTLAVLVTVSIILPSRITMYTLAANELVQDVKDTPEAKAIREYITTELTKAVKSNEQEKK